MKILIADDDEDQLFVRGMLLRQNGFEVMEAADAKTALGQDRANKPECAILDLHLPTVEAGIGLIRELKKSHPAIHIIVLTGGESGEFLGRSERDLIDEVVVKGSPSANLIRKLKALAEGPVGRGYGLGAGGTVG